MNIKRGNIYNVDEVSGDRRIIVSNDVVNNDSSVVVGCRVFREKFFGTVELQVGSDIFYVVPRDIRSVDARRLEIKEKLAWASESEMQPLDNALRQILNINN